MGTYENIISQKFATLPMFPTWMGGFHSTWLFWGTIFLAHAPLLCNSRTFSKLIKKNKKRTFSRAGMLDYENDLAMASTLLILHPFLTLHLIQPGPIFPRYKKHVDQNHDITRFKHIFLLFHNFIRGRMLLHNQWS